MSTQQSVHAGGRPRLSSEVVQKRREEAYRLSLLGFSQREIAEALRISQGAVSQAIEIVKRGSAWASKTAEERHTELNRQCYDLAMLTIREAARIFLSPASEASARLGALRQIQSGGVFLSRLLPELEMVKVEEQIRAMNAELWRLNEDCERLFKKREEERLMATRVIKEPSINKAAYTQPGANSWTY